MNKLLKTTGIFILGIGLLTGCTDKVAKKVDTNDNITTEVKTTEENPASLANLQKEVEHVAQTDNNINNNNIKDNNNTNYNINKKVTTKVTTPSKQTIQNNNTQAYKHDLAKAGEILQPMAYGMLNLQGSSTANVVRYIASNDGSDNVVKQINLTKILDLLNTYNAQTFQKQDVLQRLQNDKEIEFVQLNNHVADYNKENLEKLMNHKNKVVYFAKDQIFLAKSDIGYGGATDAIFMPVEKWDIKGDRILIPYENVATRKPVGMMTLRLNNKNYTSGANRTMYYVERFELY
ncbi:hypothetical protein PNO24_08840 [Gemella haemolysans]|uniref:hypothetical protein n=1 Tax=Gemella haemolysans TaxID=1379 RepID=UPI002330C801|nr:hypothetical protein [Gemella haemolysans]MDB6214016.1 hypothetical protein [Gemella haemolysans]